MLFLFFKLVISKTTNQLFVRIEDNHIAPYKVNLRLTNIKSSVECVVACQVTFGCVGGRFFIEMCELVTDNSGVMSYTYRKEIFNDFVFGIFCDSSVGYIDKSYAFLKDHNDKIVATTNLELCKKECSKLSWCLSADVNPAACYLAGVNQHHVRINSYPYSNHKHSSKKCFKP